MISDLHFDPMADPGLVDRLASVEIENWRAVLESSGEMSLGRYGAAASWLLLRSAFRQMKETRPDAAFLLVPGDFLAHSFRRHFDAAANDHSDAAYRQSVDKTVRFLAQQIDHTFPDTPILPALGNNDEVCGDFRLQPDGPFLADMLPVYRELVGANRNTGFDRDWTSYGNYSVAHPGVRSVRVVFANTVFFLPRYRNACGSPSEADPGRAPLAWLEAELAAAKRAQEHVWCCIMSRRASTPLRRLFGSRVPRPSCRSGMKPMPSPFMLYCGVMRVRSSPASPAIPIWTIFAWSATTVVSTPSR
jgi:sphingomyelin phosphodiesterase acid-like 3